MAGVSFLALLDDIATVLDDVAVLSKVAAKKSAGVLGDDLAVNAEQVSGVQAARELPVVWAVAKGSLINKAILVPAALLISLFLPWLITPLMVLGGLFLCYEGFEKLAHRWLHPAEDTVATRAAVSAAAADPAVDLVAFERDKIKGAIRTDFILSAEIMVIALKEVLNEPVVSRGVILAVVGVGITVAVYGVVALIVKMDDIGLKLAERPSRTLQRLGRMLVTGMPKVLSWLSVIGTAAMLWVGGHILLVGFDELGWTTPYHLVHDLEHLVHGVPGVGGVLGWVANTLASALVGLVVGLIIVTVVEHLPFRRSKGGHEAPSPSTAQ
jgi:predicted DNA repair protein MutK